MKNRKKRIISVFLSIVFLMISCQQEVREEINPDEDNSIPKDSQLAMLMKNIVTHDGSFDDVVDGGNCYSINLPYTITKNAVQEIVIDQIEDYDQLNEFDNIQIQFPITVTKDNHQEEIVENNLELQALAVSCEIQDDDIECVDFVYPFRFATFDADFNIFSTKEVIHDAQVFNFMENLDINTSVGIKYPISLLLTNGEFLEVTHNEELLSRILAFQTSCDENDE